MGVKSTVGFDGISGANTGAGNSSEELRIEHTDFNRINKNIDHPKILINTSLIG